MLPVESPAVDAQFFFALFKCQMMSEGLMGMHNSKAQYLVKYSCPFGWINTIIISHASPDLIKYLCPLHTWMNKHNYYIPPLPRLGPWVPGHHLSPAARPRELFETDDNQAAPLVLDEAHQDLRRSRLCSCHPSPPCRLPHLQSEAAGDHYGYDDGAPWLIKSFFLICFLVFI